MTNIITPWEVKGDVDYDKLITEFGLEPFKKLPKIFNENLLFRRKVIFAHRDFGKILFAIEKKKPFVMMTGLMPTGKFHIGHMILAKQFEFYQKLGAKIFISVADIESYIARNQNLEKSREIAIDQYITNYIALGLSSKKCDIYFQSERDKKNAKKSIAYYKLQNILSNHITFNEFKAVYGEVNPGKLNCSLLQASDMLHAQLEEFEGNIPIVVPVGADQEPHIRLTRDMTRKVREYTLEPMASTYNFFMPGLGGGKMSASDPNSYIALTDDEKTIKNKINKYAFSGGKNTLEEHRKFGGNPEIDVCFQYLRFFFEPNDKKLKKISDDYKSGTLLTGELKAITIEKINSYLKEIKEKREKAKDNIYKYINLD